jgi:hypothetical protein
MSDHGYRDDLHAEPAFVEGEEYSDSQRLDELYTADDYNRFEENMLALDHDLEPDPGWDVVDDQEYAERDLDIGDGDPGDWMEEG